MLNPLFGAEAQVEETRFHFCRLTSRDCCCTKHKERGGERERPTLVHKFHGIKQKLCST